MSSFISVRLGRLSTLGAIAIDDLSRLGDPTLRRLDLVPGIYNVFVEFTGDRKGPVIAYLAITNEQHYPTLRSGAIASWTIDCVSGFVMIADYGYALLASADAERQAHQAINRSHLRAAITPVEATADLISWDLGPMAVCETGFGPGQYPLMVKWNLMAVSFLKRLASDSRVVLPSSAEA